MTGWIADFCRFWWALFYWNTRKTWFRLHGAHRDSCPCQVFSDSGHALDSRCQAVESWYQPRRFRKVCPLLTETKDGWRCGVDAERVRPFWGRAALFSSTALLALYLVGTLTVYAVLHAASYEVSYRSVVWPPHWPELRGSQERLHATRAQQALAAGDYQAAILSLQTICQLNPRNHSAGLALANLIQITGQPSVADHIYARLLHDVPEQRTTTARLWGRALLAGGNYAQLKHLAVTMLSEDSGRREAWLHALLFAARQTHDQALLRDLLKDDHGLPNWCLELIDLEQLVLDNRLDQAIPRLSQQLRPTVSYFDTYQIDRLLRLGHPELAGKLIDAYGDRLPADEAAFLRLRAGRAQNRTSRLDSEYDALLSYPLTPRLGVMFCVSLLEQPAPGLLNRFLDRFAERGPALTAETLPLYHAVYLVAVNGQATGRAAKLNESIRRFTSAEAKALRGLGELLVKGPASQNLSPVLPLVPLPLEVVYAIVERSPPQAAP